MEELHILLTSNKEHRKVFPNVPTIWFHIYKSLKDYLVKVTLHIGLEDVNHLRRKFVWSVNL